MLFHNIEIISISWNSTKIFNDAALILAARRGHTEIVRELLKHEEIDINIKGI